MSDKAGIQSFINKMLLAQKEAKDAELEKELRKLGWTPGMSLLDRRLEKARKSGNPIIHDFFSEHGKEVRLENLRKDRLFKT